MSTADRESPTQRDHHSLPSDDHTTVEENEIFNNNGQSYENDHQEYQWNGGIEENTTSYLKLYIKSVIQQTIILCYKNIKYKIKKPFQTISAFTFPIQLVLILWIISNFLFTSSNNGSAINNIMLDNKSILNKNDHHIYISNTIGNEILNNNLLSILQNKTNINYNVDNTNAEYLENYKNYLLSINLKSKGITFTNRTSSLYQNQYQDYKYYLELQKYVNLAIFKTKNTKIVNSIKVNSLNLPNQQETTVSSFTITITYSMLFSFSILNFFNPNLITVVTEKQSKIKSFMILMGCNNSSYILSYFLSWFIEIFILMILTTTSILILNTFKNLNIFIFASLFLLYLSTGIPLILIIGSMFNDPKKALFVSMLFFMVLEVFWIIFRLVLPILSQNVFNYLRYFIYLFSPITFSDLIYELVSKYENLQLIQTNFGLLIGYLFLDLFLYILIAILFDKLSFKSQNQSIFEFFKNITLPIRKNNNENFIRIEKITKTFKKDTSKTNSIFNFFKPKTEILTVLNDLDLNIKKGEITCLLGKNGSGKSTLFSLIVGLLKPDDGNIYINDLNVKNNIDDIRSKLGICPQDDLIFQNLSVLDHLRIFSIIKTSLNGCGIIYNFREMDKIIDRILDELEFKDFKYKIASDLSGGQKRKLAFAISIIGDPEILLIDEVSSGMDIQNRQLIWTILQKFRRNGKIVFLTTHQMEEADAIADVIHILKDGKMEVSGSPLYLKNHYGIGYCLDMICTNSGESIRKTREFLLNFISDSSSFESSGNECKCTLSIDLLPQFPTLLRQLTEKKDEIGLVSFIVTQSTLEQVFLELNPEMENTTQ